MYSDLTCPPTDRQGDRENQHLGYCGYRVGTREPQGRPDIHSDQGGANGALAARGFWGMKTEKSMPGASARGCGWGRWLRRRDCGEGGSGASPQKLLFIVLFSLLAIDISEAIPSTATHT